MNIENFGQRLMQENDKKWMKYALDLAAQAGSLGEIPVGAVVVKDDQILGQGYNLKEAEQNPLSHAEVIAIEAAARNLRAWRLAGTTLYVTLEPCLMCAGALIHARVDRLVYAARDPKTGAVDSIYQVLSDKRLNHQPVVESGILAEESSMLLSKFFRDLREKKAVEGAERIGSEADLRLSVVRPDLSYLE